MSFAIAKPVPVFFSRYLDQFFAILKGDQKALEKNRRDYDWYDSPQDLHGTWFLEVLEHHFKNNELYEGTWDIGGSTPKLSDITCPIFVYAGEDDDITHWRQAKGILDKVSSLQKHFRCFKDAGHTAVFARTSCINTFIGDFY